MRIRARSLVRMFPVLAALPLVLLFSSPASAAVYQAGLAAGGEGDSFGLLGPVGLVAIALGLAGMIVGAVRHRRRSRVAGETQAGVDADCGAGEEATLPTFAPVDPQH